MGQRLATRIRVLLLRALLAQDIAFFDVPENSSSALLSALASDAASVRGAVGDRVGHLLTLLSCIVGSYVIAFKNRCGSGWRGRVGQQGDRTASKLLYCHPFHHSHRIPPQLVHGAGGLLCAAGSHRVAGSDGEAQLWCGSSARGWLWYARVLLPVGWPAHPDCCQPCWPALPPLCRRAADGQRGAGRCRRGGGRGGCRHQDNSMLQHAAFLCAAVPGPPARRGPGALRPHRRPGLWHEVRRAGAAASACVGAHAVGSTGFKPRHPTHCSPLCAASSASWPSPRWPFGLEAPRWRQGASTSAPCSPPSSASFTARSASPRCVGDCWPAEAPHDCSCSCPGPPPLPCFLDTASRRPRPPSLTWPRRREPASACSAFWTPAPPWALQVQPPRLRPLAAVQEASRRRRFAAPRWKLMAAWSCAAWRLPTPPALSAWSSKSSAWRCPLAPRAPWCAPGAVGGEATDVAGQPWHSCMPLPAQVSPSPPLRVPRWARAATASPPSSAC